MIPLAVIAVSLITVFASAENYYGPSDNLLNAIGMSKCQYNLMLQITSQFETGSPVFNYQYCEATPDAQGISAGFISFTTCGGGIQEVVSKYLNNANHWYWSLDKYKDSAALAQCKNANYCGTSSKRITPSGLSTFCQDWTSAARDDGWLLQAQQDVVFNSFVFTALWIQYDVRSALGKAMLFDAGVQLGTDTALLLARQVGGTAGGGDNEKAWLNTYNAKRKALYKKWGPAYVATNYRIDAWTSLMNSGNYGFDNNQVDYVDRKQKTQLTCPF